MKYLAFIFVVLYIYSVAYSIFLTELIRIPAPILFGLPLVLLFKDGWKELLYGRELLLFTVAIFLYYAVGISDYVAFTSNSIEIFMCAFFFNFYVGANRNRFETSIHVFFLLLIFSAVVMVLNSIYFAQINDLRSMLMGEKVMQSPSGIAVYQFNFGYQLAALVPFLFILTFTFKKSILLKGLSLFACLLFIYLGMQRSVLVGFAASVLLFLWLYYNYKAVFIIALGVSAGILLYTYVLKDNFDSSNNIVSKNVQNEEEYNRSRLSAENLRIYAEYPLGLIFYGKKWGDVIYRNEVFSSGITSHNAYLMFLTYLGPFLGFGLLIGLYYKVAKIALFTLRNIRKKENALMICLCFAFFAVSINSLSHNAWLVNANGPTIFLYFAILHLSFLMNEDNQLSRS